MTASQAPGHGGRAHVTQRDRPPGRTPSSSGPANDRRRQPDTRDHVRVWLIPDEHHWVPVLALDNEDRVCRKQTTDSLNPCDAPKFYLNIFVSSKKNTRHKRSRLLSGKQPAMKSAQSVFHVTRRTTGGAAATAGQANDSRSH